jgi:hypothetical protein
MKIFIQNTDDKFINNLSLIKDDENLIACGDIQDNLYQIYYRYGFDCYIFLASKFHKETFQFILEFGQKTKCFIYHDIFRPEIIENNKGLCKHLVNEKGIDNTILIPTLVNREIFNNQKLERFHKISCFIDKIEKIPEQLLKKIYPNSKLEIKLFNNEKIKHPLNIGKLQEKEKAEILNKSEFFLSLDGFYETEAFCCGAKVIDIESVETLESKNISLENVQSYQNFFRDLLV